MSLYQDQVNDIWADWHQQDYAALKQAVKLAVTQDLASLPEPPPGEDWYGYSLHTCNGFLHVGAILNAITWSIAENTDSVSIGIPTTAPMNGSITEKMTT